MAPRNGEIAARLRAARGYKGFTQAELAKKLDISVETLSRMENGKGPVSDRRRDRIGSLCGVPAEFMLAGFAPLERPLSDVERELHALREQQDALAERLRALESGKGRLGSRLRPIATEADVAVERGAAPTRRAK